MASRMRGPSRPTLLVTGVVVWVVVASVGVPVGSPIASTAAQAGPAAPALTTQGSPTHADASLTTAGPDITTCQAINQSGTYDLTTNINTQLSGRVGADEACLRITASDVVLDGNGHRITANGSGIGVNVTSSTRIDNVTVRNLTLTALEEGITTVRANTTIHDTTIRNSSEDGVLVKESSRATITHTAIRNNRRGVVVRLDSRANITHTTIRNTHQDGVVVGFDSRANITHTTIRNTSEGVFVLGFSRARITHTTIRNTENGVHVQSQSKANITNTTIRNSSEDGVVVFTSRANIANTTIRNTGNDGVVVILRSRANITTTTIRNTSDGVVVGFDSRANITHTTIRNNRLGGVVVETSSSARITHTTIRNASPGVFLTTDAPATETTIRFNDLPTATIAINNTNSTASVDARFNYYGSTCPDPEIRGNVAYRPVLLDPPDQITGTAVQTFGSCLRMPADGSVYALGTPAPLSGTLSGITNGFNGTVYVFNATTDTWERATGSETLGAMEAAVVVPTSDARALMDFADATPARPTQRTLVEGWNFVAARYHARAEAAFPVRSTEFAELLSVFSEPRNQPNTAGDAFIEYTFGGPAPPVVSPFTGYFLYLDAPETIPGKLPVGVTTDDIPDALYGPTEASSSLTSTTANATAGQTTDSGVPPALPAAYYGRVELHGLPLANVTVTAIVDGEAKASIRTDARGQFGSAGAFARKLQVSAAPGATVRFRVAGVNVTRTVTYTPGAVTQLTLRPAFEPDLPAGIAPRANTSAPPARVTPPALRHGNLTLDLPPTASVQSITASSTNETYSVRVNVTGSARNVTVYVRASVIESRIGGLGETRLLIDGTETEFYVISEGEIRYVAFVVPSFSERTLTFTSEPGVSLGDVNGDGSINTGDVIQVQRSIVGLSTDPAFSPEAADVTGDGTVDTGDVIQIQRFIVGLSSVLD